MQNKIINDQGSNPGFIQNDEKILYLEDRIKKLGEICTDLNPYMAIPEDFKLRLREFNIMEFSDPFKITNALLILLEDTIDELHILKPFNDN
ncbi:MAG: hypothetical protein PHY93_00510 [Bacteriovorax sp.]|nr:hypothetical protein [Bacteriovorax sp.]